MLSVLRRLMLNERLSAARAVAAELLPAETNLDNAIVSASKLTIAIVEGRRKAKLPITIGQDGLGKVVAATAKLIDARADLGEAHAAFRQVKDDIGLRTVAMGDLWDCPKLAIVKTDQKPANAA